MAKPSIFSLLPWLTSQAKNKTFTGGLVAPIGKLVGGGQNVYGQIQKLIPAIKNPGKTVEQLRNTDKLYRAGEKNVREGLALRRQNELTKLFSTTSPAGWRAGRALGAVAIGAPLVYLPNNLASYAGATTVDKEDAANTAKLFALNRLNERLSQYASLPFWDRLSTAWSPETFSKSIASSNPQISPLLKNIQNKNINNPGIMKYLMSFNPFSEYLMSGATPEAIIAARTRKEMMDQIANNVKMGSFNKEAAKNPMTLWKALSKGWKEGGKAWFPKKPVNFRPEDKMTPLQNMAKAVGYYPRANPFVTLTGAGVAAGIPLSFLGGRQAVYNQAAQDAATMADIEFIKRMNAPGFGAGLGRFISALAPSFFNNMALQQASQNLFPQGLPQGAEDIYDSVDMSPTYPTPPEQPFNFANY